MPTIKSDDSEIINTIYVERAMSGGVYDALMARPQRINLRLTTSRQINFEYFSFCAWDNGTTILDFDLRRVAPEAGTLFMPTSPM